MVRAFAGLSTITRCLAMFWGVACLDARSEREVPFGRPPAFYHGLDAGAGLAEAILPMVPSPRKLALFAGVFLLEAS